MLSFKNIVNNPAKLKSIAVVAVYVFLMVLAGVFLNGYTDQTKLQSIVESTGSLGIVLFLLIEIIYVTFTPMLNTAIYISSGYIFGAQLGFIINFLATTTGLFLIIFLVRRYGRPLLQKIISPKLYSRFDLITQKIGPILLLVVYVIPFTPDDELTYIVAAGPISIKRFILPILLGNIGKSALAYIGAMGTSGVVIAAQARLVMLVIGLIMVGAQEYILRKSKK